MYKLYGPAASRVFRCIWTFCEIGEPFEHIHLDLLKGDALSSDFLNKNPMGKVPVLEFEGNFLFESGAICSFISQRARTKLDLIGDDGSFKRAEVNKWLFFTLSELEQPLWNIRKHTLIYPESVRCENIIQSANIDFTRALNTLKKVLDGNYLVSDTFSLADIFVAQTLFWAKEVREIESDLSFFSPYIKGLKEREGFPNIKDYLPKI
jgi:glutathione S-transferase